MNSYWKPRKSHLKAQKKVPLEKKTIGTQRRRVARGCWAGSLPGASHDPRQSEMDEMDQRSKQWDVA